MAVSPEGISWDPTRKLQIDYTNHRGERAWRVITPIRLQFATSEYHPGPPQWAIVAFAHDRGGFREFPLSSIHETRLCAD